MGSALGGGVMLRGWDYAPRTPAQPFDGAQGERNPQPAGEPSPPWSPSHAKGASSTSSTLRVIKGEGEIRTEGCTGAVHPCGPLVQYWGKRGWIPDGGRE